MFQILRENVVQRRQKEHYQVNLHREDEFFRYKVLEFLSSSLIIIPSMLLIINELLVMCVCGFKRSITRNSVIPSEFGEEINWQGDQWFGAWRNKPSRASKIPFRNGRIFEPPPSTVCFLYKVNFLSGVLFRRDPPALVTVTEFKRISTNKDKLSGKRKKI